MILILTYLKNFSIHSNYFNKRFKMCQIQNLKMKFVPHKTSTISAFFTHSSLLFLKLKYLKFHFLLVFVFLWKKLLTIFDEVFVSILLCFVKTIVTINNIKPWNVTMSNDRNFLGFSFFFVDPFVLLMNTTVLCLFSLKVFSSLLTTFFVHHSHLFF